MILDTLPMPELRHTLLITFENGGRWPLQTGVDSQLKGQMPCRLSAGPAMQASKIESETVGPARRAVFLSDLCV